MADGGNDLSGQGFLAAPGDVDDWRRVALTDAALEAGILEGLPEGPEGLAYRLGLDPEAVRVVLEALREWDVVEVQDGGGYRPGPAAPDVEAAAVLRHHARAIGRWSSELTDRLQGDPSGTSGSRGPEDRERWLQALAVHARSRAEGVVDRCLDRFPQAQRVLDLAGGHGEYGLEFARRGCEVTLQDLPETIELVGRWPALRDGALELFAGDVFDWLPAGPFDLILCAGFTHTQSAERVAALLGRLAAVTAPSGGVAVHTFLRGRRPIAPIFAVQMLLVGGGADTHGEEEYRAWLAAAGYERVEVTDLDGRSLLLAGRTTPN